MERNQSQRRYSAAEYMSRIRICGQILLSPLISDEEYRGILWKYKQQAMEIEKTIERKRNSHNSSKFSCTPDLQFPMQEPGLMDKLGVNQEYLDVSDEQGADDHIVLPIKTITTITTTSDEQGSPICGGNTNLPCTVQEVFNHSSIVGESRHFLEANDAIVKDTNNNKPMDNTDTEDSLSVCGDPSEKRHTSDVHSSDLDDSGVSQITNQSCGTRLQRQGTFVVDVPSPALLEYAKEIGHNNDNPMNLHQDDLPQVPASSTFSIKMEPPVSYLHEESSDIQDPKFSNEVEVLDKEQYYLRLCERCLEIILTKLDEKHLKEAAEFQERQVYEKSLLIQYVKRYCRIIANQPPENELTFVEIADAERLLTGFGIPADVPQILGDQEHLGNSMMAIKDTTSNTVEIQVLDSHESCEETSGVEDLPTTEKLDLYSGVDAVASCGSVKTEDIDEKIQKAASKINAAARGYLTRKLMKSSHVKSIMELITSTVEFALQLQQDAEINVVPSDVQLHGRLIGQVTAACNELYDIFFNKSVHERMLIIAADRKKRIKSPVEKRLSSATKKVIKRKLLKVAHPDSNTNAGGKEELQGQSHFSCAEFNSSSPTVADPIGPERVRSPPSSPPKKTLRKSSLRSPPQLVAAEMPSSVRSPPQLVAAEMPSSVRSPPQLVAAEMPSSVRSPPQFVAAEMPSSELVNHEDYIKLPPIIYLLDATFT